MTFVSVATIDEIKTHEPLAVEHGDYEIAIVAVDGELFAIADECSHGRVKLSEGDVVDCTLECFLHGSRFDLRTGRPLTPPATKPAPVYPVRVEGTQIMVDFDHPITEHQES